MTDADCITQLCVDGVCCDGACNGICFACGSEGSCTAARAGADPHDDCAATDACSELVGTCGCADGKQGGAEDGVDCGGPCPPCGSLETTCTDGIDDEGDGLVDCADPDCAPHAVCAPALPGGWSGPAILYVGAAPPPCPAKWADLVLDGKVNFGGFPADCLDCACGGPQGGMCTEESLGSVSFFAAADCVGPATTYPLTSGCNEIPTTNALSFSTGPASAVGGSCVTKGGGVASLPPPTSVEARLCTGAVASTGSCGLCVPVPQGPFNQHPCVYQTGDVACPAGYEDRRVVFSGPPDDARGCTDCTCGEIKDGSCSGGTRLAVYDGCVQELTGAPNPSDCRVIDGVVESVQLQVLDYSFDGWCSPTGGTPTGGVTGTAPTTVCCTP